MVVQSRRISSVFFAEFTLSPSAALRINSAEGLRMALFFREDFDVGHPDFGVGEPAMLRQPIYPAQANRIFWLEWAPGGCVVSYLLSLNGQ